MQPKPEVYEAMYKKLQAKEREVVQLKKRIDDLQRSLSGAHKMIMRLQNEVRLVRDGEQSVARRRAFEIIK